jgi:hypothetical protein
MYVNRFLTVEISPLTLCANRLLLLASAAIVCTLWSPMVCGQQGSTKRVVEPKAVIDDIDSHGTASVVKKLNIGNGRQWRAVIAGIETGSPPWLAVARRLLTATDAGRTTDLYFALSLALTRNADGVLSLVGQDLPIDRVCSVPYIEPDEKTIVAHRIKVRAALQKVTSASLDSRKRACLEIIDQ